MIERARKRLSKRAKRGFRGWPLATVALYGPDDTMATKLTVGILPGEDAEATDLRRWLSKEVRECSVGVSHYSLAAASPLALGLASLPRPTVALETLNYFGFLGRLRLGEAVTV